MRSWFCCDSYDFGIGDGVFVDFVYGWDGWIFVYWIFCIIGDGSDFFFFDCVNVDVSVW